LPVVTTTAPYPTTLIGAGVTVSIRGTSQDSEYAAVWKVNSRFCALFGSRLNKHKRTHRLAVG
jgi:hypothetical protein